MAETVSSAGFFFLLLFFSLYEYGDTMKHCKPSGAVLCSKYSQRRDKKKKKVTTTKTSDFHNKSNICTYCVLPSEGSRTRVVTFAPSDLPSLLEGKIACPWGVTAGSVIFLCSFVVAFSSAVLTTKLIDIYHFSCIFFSSCFFSLRVTLICRTEITSGFSDLKFPLFQICFLFFGPVIFFFRCLNLLLSAPIHTFDFPLLLELSGLHVCVASGFFFFLKSGFNVYAKNLKTT